MPDSQVERELGLLERAGKRPRFFQNEDDEYPQVLRASLEDVLGPLSDNELGKLLPLAAVDLRNAINAHIDGFSSSYSVGSDPAGCQNAVEPRAPANPERITTHNENSTEVVEPKAVGAAEAPIAPKTEVPIGQESSKALAFDGIIVPRRYIGSFQSEIWLTKSLPRGSLKYGQKLSFERPKPANSRKEDFIVRVRSGRGLSFARLTMVDARYVSVIMESGVCEFSGICIFADGNLSAGSTVVVQVDCYMPFEAFQRQLIGSNTNDKKRPFDEGRYTSTECSMRLRQIALVHLFDKLGLTENGGRVPDMQEAVDAIQNSQAELGKDLKQDEAEKFYKDTAKAHLPETDPSDTFALTLFPYQKKALYWMLQREGGEERGDKLHPLWTEFQWPNEKEPFYVNLHSGELSLDRPVVEAKNIGGILADEMGLGKTISTLSLIHSSSGLRGASELTLIVVPMGLMSQWEKEIAASSVPGSVEIMTYYSSARGDLVDFLAKPFGGPKIIITSYGIVCSEYKLLLDFTKKNDLGFTNRLRDKDPTMLGLFGVQFYRVVLDEAHTIKNRSTLAALSCCELDSVKKWALTGTPIVNRLDDLYSLVKFLGLEPWNNISYWRSFVTVPFESGTGARAALEAAQSILTPLCLRRTKAMQFNGKPLVEIPERVVEIRRVGFSEAEKKLYSFVYAHGRATIQKQIRQKAGNKYSAMMTVILRLRQICCHPKLVADLFGKIANTDMGQEELLLEGHSPEYLQELESLLARFSLHHSASELKGIEAHQTLARVSDTDNLVCPICTTDPIPRKDIAVTECLHLGCYACLTSHIEFHEKKGQRATCPMCRKDISSGDLYALDSDGQAPVLRRCDDGSHPAKIRALISELKFNRGNGKNVVFSQFTSFLDIIESELAKAKINTVRFDGSMSRADRTGAVEKFQNATEDIVFLLSLKAGGIGLNLVCAQQAFLMDPWWSYAVEAQAMDRLHRVGQKANVRIVRFIVEGSIEERILKVQERKKTLSSVVTGEQRRMEQFENIKILLDLDSEIPSSFVDEIPSSAEADEGFN